MKLHIPTEHDFDGLQVNFFEVFKRNKNHCRFNFLLLNFPVAKCSEYGFIFISFSLVVLIKFAFIKNSVFT